MNLRSTIAVAFSLALTAHALALSEETFEVKIDRPTNVGLVLSIEVKFRQNDKFFAHEEDRAVLVNETKREIEYVAERTVLAVDDEGQVSAASFVITHWNHQLDGAETGSVPAGTLIKASRNGDKTKFESDDFEISKELHEALDRVFNVDREEVSNDLAYGTRERKRVGESWNINPEMTAKQEQAEGLEVRAEQVRAQQRFVNASLLMASSASRSRSK